ncbi:MAG: hypothetical protein PHN37_01250 [Candidatus Pacebacteria bacterium]|nr:hypothetical protein [Candidatus Paceibacterota bacterium]
MVIIKTMRIFELHFNPDSEQGNIFETFVHQPTNIYEKRGGYFFSAGELEKSIPENKHFLEKLNACIKKNYYSNIQHPEKSLSNTLKKANEYLAEQVKKENVHWLGNLNYAIAAIKNSELFFTKTGSMKALLIRAGEITDLSQSFNNQEIEPYPLRIFLSIITGKLAENDLILILNKNIYELFEKEEILKRFKNITELNEEKINQLIPSSLKNKKVSGFCLLVFLKNHEDKSKKIINKKNNDFKKLNFSDFFKRFSFKKKKLKIPNFLEKGILKKKFNKKKLILIFLLLFLIFVGYLFRQKEIQKNKQKTAYFQEQIIKAQELDTEEANIVLQELLTKTNDKNFIKEIEDILKNINNLEIVEPKLLLSFEQNLSDIIYINNQLYLFFPNKACNLQKECTEIEYKLVTPYLNSFLAFLSPEKISFANEIYSIPSFDFNFDQIYSYYSSLYFLDKNNCSILFYQNLGNLNWQKPIYWIKQNHPCNDLAIDGSIWVLKDNSVDLFYQKELIQSFPINTFPAVNKLSQIETNKDTNYLYFLDPENKRIIITNKKLEIIKQLQSEKFDQLKKIAINKNKMFIANKNKVYELELF